MNTTTDALLYLAKCCNGHVAKAEFSRLNIQLIQGWGLRCGCGDLAFAKRVNATYKPDRTCDKRCTNATGVNCECSCNGHNHGAGKRF